MREIGLNPDIDCLPTMPLDEGAPATVLAMDEIRTDSLQNSLLLDDISAELASASPNRDRLAALGAVEHADHVLCSGTWAAVERRRWEVGHRGAGPRAFQVVAF